jgi:Cu+-exporting ATPase
LQFAMNRKIQEEEALKSLRCYHCGTECSNQDHTAGDKIFCSESCRNAYAIIEKNGLTRYYEIHPHPGLRQAQGPGEKERFDFLDLPEIRNEVLRYSDGKQSHLYFYLPQMHCSACVWLLEQLPKMNRGIVRVQVHFSEKRLYIVYNEEQTSLRRIVELLAGLGYEPLLNLPPGSHGRQERSARLRIIKIGVAGFCFANIMMLNLPEYLSGSSVAETRLGFLFNVVILLLSLPAFLYSALEFYQRAWTGLKAGLPNIDLLVSLALILLFGRSLYEMQAGIGNGYLDSMSGIVFFLLISRFIHERSMESLIFQRDHTSFFPIAVMARRNGEVIPIPVEKIQTGDLIYIHNQEIVPVDSILVRGKASLDYSFVTGESDKSFAEAGDRVFAGARQTGAQIVLSALRAVEQRYLNELWNRSFDANTEQEEQRHREQLGKYFTVAVLLLAGTAAGYWFFQHQHERMWNALTTVLIVACPFALLFASHFTSGHLLRILSQNRLYLRHPDVLGAIAQTQHVVLDKTGTLTEGARNQVHYFGQPMSPELSLRVYSLARQSTHPISLAIYHSGQLREPLEVVHFKTTEGGGIEAWLEEHHLKMGSAEFIGVDEPHHTHGTCTHIREDGRYIGYFLVRQQYREKLEDSLQDLQSDYEVSIISGDNDGERAYLSALLHHPENIHFRFNPWEKRQYIERLQRERGCPTLMIGDGFNDAGALRQANAGIAVTENKNNFTPSCDAILDGSAFWKLPRMLRLIRDGRRINSIIFGYSVVYNVAASWFALSGLLSPVIASFLMPANSLSIIFLAWALTSFSASRLQLTGDAAEMKLPGNVRA